MSTASLSMGLATNIANKPQDAGVADSKERILPLTHTRWTRMRNAIVAMLLVLLPATPGVLAAEPEPLVIFAAASMKGSLDAVSAAYAQAGHPAPRISYAASSALARQIEQGAPADIFVSADSEWMDHLQKNNLIQPDSRHDLLANALVLIAPADAADTSEFALRDAAAWQQRLGDGRLAVARVDSVPAGKYARAALTALGVWDALQQKLAQTDDVRQALMFVVRGETPLGIVYRTDAASGAAVHVLATFPPDTHAPIVYPVAAVVRTGANPDSTEFLQFLRNDVAGNIFRTHGFDTLP